MIEQRTDSQRHTWVLHPNRSMSWRQNRLFLLGIGGVTLLIALFWTLSGAWVVLPIAGLEVLCLGSGLYYTCWKLNFKQVIHLAADELRVEEGHYRPRRSWQLERSRVALAVERPAHPWDTMKITLFDRRHRIPLGRFLCQEDLRVLLDSLQAAGLRVRTQGLPEQVTF